ncbi:PREDICTED: UPF0605 protein CG18335-like [Dinoponera quadriceps]|uniref:UPF0605 protein CG18335-like n=1 Tax=Dinoponera quadriceps TaxID=609295 RepID=A0A6P3XWB4_DINQU|nr:PREDICTED: UPF0605 protein CG18335-like [Dinoponera quadriceps]
MNSSLESKIFSLPPVKSTSSSAQRISRETTAGMELLTTSEPHLIPGYSGYCPQFQFRCGETFAKTTHKLLLDPAVNHADALILSSRAVGEVTRPPQRDVDMVNARSKRTDSIFVHPMLPGYEGFIPRLDTRCGQRFAVHTTEQVAEFERHQLRHKEARDRLRRRIDAQQCEQGEPRDPKDRKPIKGRFRLTVLPECVGAMVNSSSDMQPLHDCAIIYREVIISGPDPPILVQPSEIYHKYVGLIPNYLGHVPGAAFRYGKTFEADTRDAKRWLRRDSV